MHHRSTAARPPKLTRWTMDSATSSVSSTIQRQGTRGVELAIGALRMDETGLTLWLRQTRIGGHPWLQLVAQIEECRHLVPARFSSGVARCPVSVSDVTV
jgi:hypothetical protein